MKKLYKIFDGITMAIFVAMVLVVVIQIIFRFILRINVPWTEELSRLLFIYVGFFGTAIAVREKELIVIDLLIQRVPAKIRNILNVVIYIVSFAFFTILLIGGIGVYRKVKDTYFATMSSVSNGWIYIALIIGMAMTLLDMMYSVLKKAREGKDDKG